MVQPNDPLGPLIPSLNLFLWGFVCWALLGPLSRWAISEILFYISLERLLLALVDFMALVEPWARKDVLKFRLFYWACILLQYLPRWARVRDYTNV